MTLRTRGWCAALIAVSVVLSACDDDPRVTRREYMPDMVDSVPYDAFMPNPVTRDGRTLMQPPAGTLPRGWTPFHYGPGPQEALRAGREVTSPFPSTPQTVSEGKVLFGRFCTPCHGQSGQGDGLVIPRFPAPPPLTAPHAKGLPDGQIFHIATYGQGVMPSHGSQIPPEDRWKIVHYVRSLQAGAPAAGGAP